MKREILNERDYFGIILYIYIEHILFLTIIKVNPSYKVFIEDEHTFSKFYGYLCPQS